MENKKKTCKICSVPIDSETDQDLEFCKKCYEDKKSRKNIKRVHQVLQEEAMKEEGEQKIKDENLRTLEKTEEEEMALVEKNLGEGSGTLEDDLQGEEEEE